MPGRLTIPSLLVLLLAVPASSEASQKFAGRWKRTTYRIKVTVQSWGPDCGQEPKAYGNNKVVEVDVVAKGNHLIFSKGGLRTDQCSSPNPRLTTVSESNVPGNWSRTCQTPKNDPKFERLETTLKAEGNNKLVFRGKTKFEWTLKGDHCVAYFDERQIYVRESGDEDEAEPPPAAKTKFEPEPGCEEHGPLKRLSVSPKDEVIGPGERVCFKAQGVDADGCRFPVNASWTAIQDEQEVGGLLSRGGCFSAGATAAESEGTYEITARSEGKSASATVTVSFPDLGDLLAARLTPTEDIAEDERGEAAAVAGAEPAAGAPAKPVPAPTPQTGSAPGSDNTVLLIAVVGVGMAVAAVLLVLAVILRRRSRPKIDERDDDDWIHEPSAEPAPSPQRPRSVSAPADPATKPTRPLREPSQPPDGGSICPSCGEILPAGSKFCPHDGSSLVPAPASETAPRPGADAGMICPRCHRGYEAGAAFCPHDSEKLESYAAWRDRRRNRGH